MYENPYRAGEVHVLERFWGKVAKGDEDTCWMWEAATDKDGYGIFWEGMRQMKAHVFSWEMANPTELLCGLCVLHHCDIPGCVNPEHLRRGTHQDNTDDCIRRERKSIGDAHYSRTNPERLARGDRNGSRTHPERLIRGDAHYTRTPERRAKAGQAKDLLAEGYSGVAVCKILSVSGAYVSRIKNRKRWV